MVQLRRILRIIVSLIFYFNKKYLKLENKSWDRNGPVVVCFYLVVLLSSHDNVSSTDYTKEKVKI